MKISDLVCQSALMATLQACAMLLPVLPPYMPLMIGDVQLLLGSSVQPNSPGPSAPAGSVGHPPFVDVVCSLSTWSSDGDGSGFGGYGGGGANTVPFWVA